jgi:Tfp pilus assembly protein PilF
LPDAIDALKISIWSSDTTEARLVLADAYEKAGMLNDARTELQTVVARDPAHAEAMQGLERLSR